MGACFHLSIFLIEILIETEKLQDGGAFEMGGGGGLIEFRKDEGISSP